MEKGDAGARAIGRGLASGWPQAAHDWFLAEVERGGASLAVQAMIRLQISLFAGICGPALPANLHKPLADLYRDRVAETMAKEMADCLAESKRMEARP